MDDADYKRKLDRTLGPSEGGGLSFYDKLDHVESGADSSTEVVLEREFQARCPTDGHTDEYDLRVGYYASSGRVVELESFAEWLDSFAEIEAPQEAWCHFICHALWTFLHPRELRVVIEGEHYGVQTTVTKERTDE